MLKTSIRALAAAFLVLLFASQAQAQRAASGTTGKSWTANGTKFQTRTTKSFGKNIDWERRATGKSGVTTINGVTWGSKVRGTESTDAKGQKIEKLQVTAQNGEVRHVTTTTATNGTVRKTINLPDGTLRRITSWKTSTGKTMTDTRDFDAAGKLVKSNRTTAAAPKK